MNDKLTGKKNHAQQDSVKPQTTLAQDIPVAAAWVARALNASGYQVDYTLRA